MLKSYDIHNFKNHADTHLDFGNLTILTGINGMGKLMIVSLRTQDFDVVILMQLFYVAISLIGNLIIDIVYGLVDPRVRVSA